MTVAERRVPAALETYLGDLVDVLAGVTELVGVYLLGSGAIGDYEEGSSDVDVVAVVPEPLDDARKRAIGAAAEAVPCPARKLELVVYARGNERHELNLNTGERLSLDPDEDPSFWFVIDRSIGERYAVPLVGPPWLELFPPVPRDAVLGALGESLDWHEQDDPADRSAVLNACRAWTWVETGEWVSKPAAAAWLRARVRAAVEAAR